MGNGARVLLAVSVWLAGRLRLLGPTPGAIKLIDLADKTTTNRIITFSRNFKREGREDQKIRNMFY